MWLDVSKEIQNNSFNPDGSSWNIKPYNDAAQSLGEVEFYEEQEGFDVLIAEINDEVAGYVAYGNQEDYGILDLIEIKPSYRGIRSDDRALSTDLARSAFEILERENEAVVLQAKSLKGPVQTIAENQGYELSGFQIEDTVTQEEEYYEGGFTAEMWKFDQGLTPMEVECYLSPKLRETANLSLNNQMNFEFKKPDSLPGISIEHNNSDISEADRTYISEGEARPDVVAEKINQRNEKDPYSWINVVELDIMEPWAYEISEKLAEKRWSLVNLSPDNNGGVKGYMAKPNKEAGSYNFTARTMDFLESTDLPYRVDRQNNKSTKVTVNPRDFTEEDIQRMDNSEIDTIFQDIISAD